MTIQAIETRYAGCRFRSRLEARWAVFFDALGINWEYEPQGYELPSGWYLPDFYLPDVSARVSARVSRAMNVGVWLEVKPALGPDDERWTELAVASGKPVYVGYGMPRPSGTSWIEGWIEEHSGPGWDRDMTFCHCWGVWATNYGPEGNYHCEEHRYIDRALVAARSARFEHGERP